MSAKRSKSRLARPLNWQFPPEVPTRDLLAGLDLQQPRDLQRAVDLFLDHVEQEIFHSWEAVVAVEQGCSLTPDQQATWEDIERLGVERDPVHGTVLRLQQQPRPSEPWYDTLNRIVPSLRIDPFVTAESHPVIRLHGWEQLAEALADYGSDLTRPTPVQRASHVVPAELRHRLWLQYCCCELEQFGAQPHETLREPSEAARVTGLIERLGRRRTSVQFLQLTLASLLQYLILPEREVPLFQDLVRGLLGVRSEHDLLANFL